jgi:outer membrane protein assembly factor BamB
VAWRRPGGRRIERPGAQLWASRFAKAGAGSQATAIVPSVGGGTVFVTGLSRTNAVTQSWETVAYSAQTGNRRWLSAAAVGADPEAAPRAIGVSPDGAKVFVTGPQPGAIGGFMTIAFDTTTGAQLWSSTSSIPGRPAVIDVFDNDVLYVTGSTTTVHGVSPDYLTIAYNAATGAEEWASRYDDKAHGTDQAAGITVVAGDTMLPSHREGYGIVAFSLGTGAVIWRNHYAAPAGANSSLLGLAIGPLTVGTVFETGASGDGHGLSDFATVAYVAKPRSGR